MKFTAAFSMIALAATAIATPADLEARTGGGKACNAGRERVCCNGLLNCLVQAIGGTCNGNAYYCKTSAPVGTLVNIAVLDCVKIL